jgi:2-polyprenyl-6-methoxyphenol hydroxylase-like FAD-dependent oxidoreductase
LIGADGGNSRVRQQFLPHAERIDTGAVGIAAKAMLTEENRRRLPPRVLEGTGLVMSPGRRGMFIGLHEFDENAPSVLAASGVGAGLPQPPAGALFDNSTSYVFWAYGAPRADLEPGRPLEQLAPPDLQRLVLDRIPAIGIRTTACSSAHPIRRRSMVSIKTSVPVALWQSRRITLIGDAIHSMTPTAASAPTRRCDAALLFKTSGTRHTAPARSRPPSTTMSGRCVNMASPRFVRRCTPCDNRSATRASASDWRSCSSGP